MDQGLVFCCFFLAAEKFSFQATLKLLKQHFKNTAVLIAQKAPACTCGPKKAGVYTFLPSLSCSPESKDKGRESEQQCRAGTDVEQAPGREAECSLLGLPSRPGVRNALLLKSQCYR